MEKNIRSSPGEINRGRRNGVRLAYLHLRVARCALRIQ